MGNSFTGGGGGGCGRKKKAKVMKIDGEIFKLKTPIQVFEVIKDYAGYVVLESKAVKRYGIRANPLDPEEFLEAGKIYFLVELPKPPVEKKVVPVTRRVQSGVKLTAKERLDCLMMSRRSASEVAFGGGGLGGSGSVRVKVRLPKAEVDKLIGESRDEVEVAERIVDLYVQKKAGGRRLGRI
ncbi:uncharacterized protein At1g66480-like [Cynara cardunculus var. scolymus]|uniref:Uncharacterized protein n=1 Tax=Cynara cardunculus var. scolymus TaxID=59895 RepID=A0A118K1G6_CYNCS|nr:uncharacterized protein At1g66480-like [Cynara cardunculus var. scolymus]KVI02777.1 Protein of unknown function DUF4228 [Cynara cardunculus var. scolymus]